jgi:hypothetical protein
MLERVSKKIHDIWMVWTKSVIRDGYVSKETADRWMRLHVPYEQLSWEEKEKDRVFAREILQEIDRGYNNGNYHIGMQLSNLKIPGGGDPCPPAVDTEA